MNIVFILILLSGLSVQGKESKEFVLASDPSTLCNMGVRESRFTSTMKIECENECFNQWHLCAEYLYNEQEMLCIICLEYGNYITLTTALNFKRYVIKNFEFFRQAETPIYTHCDLNNPNNLNFYETEIYCAHRCLDHHPNCTQFIYNMEILKCTLCLSFSKTKYYIDHQITKIVVDKRYRCKFSRKVQYNGLLTTNIRNVPCQKWNSNDPNKRLLLSDRNDSYCKESDTLGAWCYNSDTTNPRWSYCETFLCDY